MHDLQAVPAECKSAPIMSQDDSASVWKDKIVLESGNSAFIIAKSLVETAHSILHKDVKDGLWPTVYQVARAIHGCQNCYPFDEFGLFLNVKELEQVWQHYNSLVSSSTQTLPATYFFRNFPTTINVSQLCKVISSSASQLTCLSLRGCGFGDAAMGAVFTALAESKAPLAALDISANELTWKTIGNFSKHSFTANLTCLNLSANTELGDKGGCELANVLAEFKQLGELDISYTRIGNVGLKSLGAKFPQSQISKVDFSGNSLASGGLSAMVEFLPRCVFTEVRLAYCEIGDNDILAMRDGFALTEQLDLSGNNLTSKGAGTVAWIISMSSLLGVNLKWNEIGNGGDDELVKAVSEQRRRVMIEGSKYLAFRMKGLQKNSFSELDLSFARIDVVGMSTIKDRLLSQNLLRLNLKGNQLAQPKTLLTLYSFLVANQQLVELDISQNNLGEQKENQGACFVADVIKNTKLKVLKIESNEFNVQEGKIICEALVKDSSLEQLHLRYNFAGDCGITKLNFLTTVAQMRMSGKKISVEGFDINETDVEQKITELKTKTSTASVSSPLSLCGFFPSSSSSAANSSNVTSSVATSSEKNKAVFRNQILSQLKPMTLSQIALAGHSSSASIPAQALSNPHA